MHILIDLLFNLTSLYRNRGIPHQSELIFAYVIVIELDDACSKQYMKKPHVVHSHAKLGADSMALRDLQGGNLCGPLAHPASAGVALAIYSVL
jgi:hypothetical protein